MGLFDFLKKEKKQDDVIEEIEITDESIEDELAKPNTDITEDTIVLESNVNIDDEPTIPTDKDNISESTIESIEELIDENIIEISEENNKDKNEETSEEVQEIHEETNEEIKKIPEETNEEVNENDKKEGLFAKMKKGLLKTKNNFTSSIDNVFKAFTSISDDFYDELEETLILADLGAKTSMEIIETLRDKVRELKIKDTEEVKQVLIDIISEILNKDSEPLEIKSPTVILVIGVNGAGKTTSIGKLANLYKSQGKSVMLAAGDTFRAAAIEQLEEWGKRSDIPVIKHAENSDSSAVIYDAIKSSEAKNIDVLICDTAGRLHNKKNLMAELEKINRVIAKEYGNANLETFLVLDGTAGQNALEQAKQFNEVCNISGLVLTKLDGTAKGGIIISIKNEMKIPVRYIGVGESINDLQEFDSKMFSKALFETE